MNDQDIRTTGCPTKNMYAVDTTKISSYINQLLLFFDKSTNTHTHKHIRQFYEFFFQAHNENKQAKRFCEILAGNYMLYIVIVIVFGRRPTYTMAIYLYIRMYIAH